MRRFFIPRLTIFSLILLNFMLIRLILKSKRKIKTKGHMLPVDSYVHKLDIQVEKEKSRRERSISKISPQRLPRKKNDLISLTYLDYLISRL